MKLKHWVFLAIFLVGALFLWHTYNQHGGVQGVKSGIGIG